MPDPLINFSQRDLQKLKERLRRVRDERINTEGRTTPTVHSVHMDTSQAPEIYIALVPEGGLEPAEFTGTSGGPPTVLNGTLCSVYRFNAEEGELEPVDALTKRVYNLSTKAIKADSWIVIQRDKFGSWFAMGILQSPYGDTSGVGQCEFTKLNSNDCVLVSYFNSETGEVEEYYLEWDSVSETWKGLDTFVYVGGSGTFEFGYTDGEFWLKLNNLFLVPCGDGCYSGSWITGHGNDATGTSEEEQESCNATAFTVCVSCTCCPIEGWAGEGWYCVTDSSTGTGTGTSTALTECEVMYLLDEDKCDDEIIICAGPYPTQADADAACGPAPVPSIISCANAGQTPMPLGVWIEEEIPPSTVAYYCWPVSAGNYRLKYYRTMTGGSGVGGASVLGNVSACDGSTALPSHNITETDLNACNNSATPCCLNLVVPSGTTHICFSVQNANTLFSAVIGAMLEAGTC